MSSQNQDSSSLHEKIGYMRADIANIGRKIDDLGDGVRQSVKQSECTQRTRIFTEKIDELKEIIKTKQTRPDNYSVDFLLRQQTDAKGKEKERKKGFLMRVKDNLAAIIVIMTFVGVVVTILINVSHFIVGIESLLKKQNRVTEESNQEVKALKTEVHRLRDEKAKKSYYIPDEPKQSLDKKK